MRLGSARYGISSSGMSSQLPKGLQLVALVTGTQSEYLLSKNALSKYIIAYKTTTVHTGK